MGKVGAAVSSKPPGLAQADPSGRLVAGPGKTGGIDEGLDGVERVAMDPLPVGGETFDRQSQNPGGQILDPDARKNEVADVVGEVGQSATGEIVQPPEEAVPDVAVEGGCAPSQKGDPLSLQKCHMAERLSRNPLEGEIVMFPHEVIPPLLFKGVDRTDLKAGKILVGGKKSLVGNVHTVVYSRSNLK